MKILQLIQKPQPRGAEMFAAQLSTQLEALGHSSKIIAIFGSIEKHKYKADYLVLDANPKARLWDKAGWGKLAQLIKEQNPDIIQANAGDTLKYAVFSKMLFGWKQPIIFRNASTLSSYIKSPFQKLYNSFLYKQTDAIASVSKHSRKDLIKLFPGLSSKAITIPIGLDEKKVVNNPFEAFPLEQINLVHVGGFSFEKNHVGLLRIFRSVKQQQPNAHLWLVGDGSLRNSIEDIVIEHELKGCVHFTGFINNPLDYIANAHALLLPSIIEGLPGVILEAMLYETPVIAYNVGGIGEVVHHKRTGWLVESENERAFEETIHEVLQLPFSEKEQIIANAAQLVRKYYMNSHITSNFVQLYNEVLRNN
ncbi:glycosyltransferase [uncultured Pontibacter sp.]|uniref:glycosyltransferase n=1 Tax=uncultured Pontibacter sp. TaxID=453356 RepID=UPI002623528D|nr:glycosyltransferase [uncultured Pontibacter sp.]